MISFLLWLVAVELLGLAALPLALALLPRLPDRGYGLAKVLGILLVTYLNYLLGSTIGAGNNVPLLIVGLLVLCGAGIWLLRRERFSLAEWFRANRVTIGVEEAIFVALFAAWALFRAMHPGILSTEKPMDLALMTAAHKASSFPPYDPWLAGKTINYYYGGYLAVGTLVTLTGVAPAVGYNLAVALLFALVGVAAYAVALGLTRSPRWALLGPAFILLAGNLDGIGQLFDPAHGWANFDFFSASRIVEPSQCNGSCTITEFPAFSFLLADLHPHVVALPFTILAIGVALNLALAPASGWLGLAADTPRRVLTLLLAGITAGALYFFNSWDWPTYTLLIGAALLLPALAGRTGGAALQPGSTTLGQAGDAPPGTAGFQPAPVRGRQDTGSPGKTPGKGATAGIEGHTGGAPLQPRPLLEGVGLAVGVLALSYLLYISFRLGFNPQYSSFGLKAHGSPTGQVFVMFGLFLLPALAFIIARFAWREGVAAAVPSPSPRLAAASGGAVPVGSGARGGRGRAAVLERDGDDTDGEGDGDLPRLPTLALPRLSALRGFDAGLVLIAVAVALLALFKYAAGLGTFGLLLPFALAALYLAWREARAERPAAAFALLLCAGGLGLIMLCDTVFLKDNFCSPDATGACTNPLYRMNTVFKFYYQAWTVLALGAVYGLYYLSTRLRPAGAAGGVSAPRWMRFLAPGAGVALALAGGVYLLLGVFSSSPSSVALYFPPTHTTPTLDGSAYLDTYSGQPITITNAIPADAVAIRWLKAHVSGHPTILEADWTPGPPPGPQDYWPFPGYTNQELMMSRISTFTGLPAVLGWGYSHEGLWHSNGEVARRFADVTTLYTSTNTQAVGALLRQYHVGYIYVGQVEAYTYYHNDPALLRAAIGRFNRFGTVVYTAGGVTIIRTSLI